MCDHRTIEIGELADQVATVVIPLTSMMVTNDVVLSPNDVLNLEWVSDAMKNRDFNLTFPGWKFPGYIKSWEMKNNPELAEPELHITIQF